MLSIKLGSTQVKFDFSFFAVLAIFIAYDPSGYGILGLLACLCHEGGHIVALLICQRAPHELIFCGGGIKLRQQEICGSVFVLAAGCIVNYVLFVVFYFFFPQDSIFRLIFAMMNLFIGCFNLLPLQGLDGNNLLEHVLVRRFSERKAYRLMKIGEKLALVLFISVIILLFCSKKVNFSIITIVFYLFIIDFLVKI